MKRPVLTLRISRRAIGAVVLDDEQLTLIDGRHLRSTRAETEPSAVRYLRRLLDQVHPRTVIVDCPYKPGGQTEAVSRALDQLADEQRLEVCRVSLGALLEAFGAPGLPSRRALREVAEPIFATELSLVKRAVRPYILDAAAAALFAGTATELGGHGEQSAMS